MTFSGFCTPYRRSWVSYTTSSARTDPEEGLRQGGLRFFGRRRGSFGVSRILLVVLSTTALGPRVLVGLIAIVAYSYFNNRRGR